MSKLQTKTRGPGGPGSARAYWRLCYNTLMNGPTLNSNCGKE